MLIVRCSALISLFRTSHVWSAKCCKNTIFGTEKKLERLLEGILFQKLSLPKLFFFEAR
jgi:hypothetical protein